MSALKLAVIITGSIVAAAAIIMLVMKLCKKKCAPKHCACGCDDHDDIDSWDIDEDALGELELDDDCECGCDAAGAKDAVESADSASDENEPAENPDEE